MHQKDRSYTLDLIMLSKFGKNDGGRETWAYNFLPKLLNNNVSKINIFGYRLEEDEDNTDKLIKLDKIGSNGIMAHILLGKKNKFPKFFSMFFQLKSYLKNIKQPVPDCTIAMGIFELIMMISNRRYRHGLRVVWLRGVFLNEKSSRIPRYLTGISRKVEKEILKRADLILANGDDIKSYYEEYGLDIVVIKNGVDSLKWNIQPPDPSNTLKVAYIGRLSKVKGIELFLDLVQKSKTSSDSRLFEFHIVGDANNYLSKVENFKNKGWINYHGNIDNDDLPSFLKSIHICVALTFSSMANGIHTASNVLGGGGTSNALLEQMAASKIIVAWENAHFRQLLDENTAYLVEQYSVTGLYKTLLDIYSNQSEATEKGERAKETVQSYSIDSKVKQFKKILDSKISMKIEGHEHQ